MILRKLNDNHYVILAGEKTLSNNGDWYLSHPDYNKVVQWNMPLNTQHEGKQVWINKILYSTQPLENLPCTCKYGSIMTSSHPCKKECQNPKLGFDKIKPLSLSEVEEAINGYSVQKLSYEKYNDGSISTNTRNDWRECWKEGFKAHQELVKDKVFTVENLYAFVIFVNKTKPSYKKQQEFIQSLLPKTEWGIEFDEQGKIKLL